MRSQKTVVFVGFVGTHTHLLEEAGFLWILAFHNSLFETNVASKMHSFFFNKCWINLEPGFHYDVFTMQQFRQKPYLPVGSKLGQSRSI